MTPKPSIGFLHSPSIWKSYPAKHKSKGCDSILMIFSASQNPVLILQPYSGTRFFPEKENLADEGYVPRDVFFDHTRGHKIPSVPFF